MLNKALFLDRDGVINVDKHHMYKIDDCEFIPGIFELCYLAHKKGYNIVVVTNQAGIAKGYYNEQDLHKLHDYIKETFSKKGIYIEKIFYCPHHPDFTGDCNCRKPKPGMLLEAAKELKLSLNDSILIGDKESDLEAGYRAELKECYGVQGNYKIDRSKFKVFENISNLILYLNTEEVL